MTTRGDVTFTVKQYVSGTPWIAIEQLRGGDLELPGLVGLDLREGTTIEQAYEIARYLQEHIKRLTLTYPP